MLDLNELYEVTAKHLSESISYLQKIEEAELICETRLTPLCRRTAQDATTGERLHLLLSQSSGYSVFFPSRAFLLICGSEFHGDAHGAFVTLPILIPEKARRLSWVGARNPAGWAFA